MEKKKQLTNDQVIAELRERVKPYIGIMPQGKYSDTLIRIEAGLSKIKTVREFFGKFGYTGDWNAWTKTE